MKKFFILILMGLIIVPTVFSQNTNYSGNQLTKAKRGDKYGYLDNNGSVVIPFIYDEIGEFDNNNSPVRAKKDKYWGYVDCKGKELTKFCYRFASPFYEEDLALVCNNYFDDESNIYYRYGYVNKNGEEIGEVKKDSYKKAFPFSDGMAAVMEHKGKQFIFIDSKLRKVIDARYDDVMWGFVEGLAWVKNGNSWGMINKLGKVMVGFDYSSIKNYDPNTGFADAVKNGVVYYFDAKGQKYNSSEERRGKNPKPRIEWPIIPQSTTQQQFAFKATISSDSPIEFCHVYLNEMEIKGDASTGGSFVVKDSYNTSVSRTLTLSSGRNIIKIIVKNAGGEIVEERSINYQPPYEKATIVWEKVPEDTHEKQFTLKAQISSKSEIEYYHVYHNGNNLKGSIVVLDDFNVTINKTFKLTDGVNTFKVVVKNAGGEVTRQQTIRYTPQGNRIALVIGNGSYSVERLNCPENDADAIETKLQKLGYRVIKKNNVKRDDLSLLVDSFEKEIESKAYDIALFYYSGHGSQADDINYLIPVDYQGGGNEKYYGFPVTDVLGAMTKAKKKVVILDACRTFPGTKGKSGGLAAMNHTDTFISFAAAPGEPSIEVFGEPYSRFTAALLKVLETPNLTINQVFMKVIKRVKEDSNKTQIPYVSHSLEEDFIFN